MLRLLMLALLAAPAADGAQTDETPRFARWSPDRMELVCAAAHCPPAVGSLIFARDDGDAGVRLENCTAFLASDDTVLANAHCDHFADHDGYFVVRRGGRQEFRRVVGLGERLFTAGTDEAHSGRPDLLSFKLESGFPGLAPLELARGTGAGYDRLTLYAVDPGADGKTFVVNRRVCRIHRHEVYFPFAIADNPDVIISFGCETRPGNSGAPMFGPDERAVEVLHFGSQNPERFAAWLAKRENRAPYVYERHWLSFGANLRCLERPGHPAARCAVNDTRGTRRAHQALLDELDRLKNRQPGHEAFPYELAPGAGTAAPDREFEIFYRPVCRATEAIPPALSIPFEHVRAEYDEWAHPRLRTLAIRYASARLTAAADGARASYAVKWPAYAGRFVDPKADVRARWGDRFSIDLPRCAR